MIITQRIVGLLVYRAMIQDRVNVQTQKKLFHVSVFCCSFRAVPGFGQKYEYEEEAEDADGAVEEEGCGGGGKLVDVFERLGHHEPPQVGRGVRHRVRPPLGPAQALVRSICVPRESQCKITAELHFLLA